MTILATRKMTPIHNQADNLGKYVGSEYHAPRRSERFRSHLGGSGEEHIAITLANPGSHVAFFVRAEVTQGPDGEEILPIIYTDNYITVFPHETRTIEAKFSNASEGGSSPSLRVEGYNVPRRLFQCNETQSHDSSHKY